MIILVTALAAGLAAPAPAAARSDTGGVSVVGGTTQPVFSHAEAIREEVYVETGVDSDADGSPDRVYAQIMRPAETAEGMRVPVVYEMSPYRAGLNELEFHDVDRELPPPGQRRPEPAPSVLRAQQRDLFTQTYYDDHFVPRGYAVVLAESIGTGASEGCPTAGDRSETLAAAAVVDWLNGRAEGFTAAGEPLTADWTTGAVGMMGVSYNGTLPNAVAATGVEGLRTIVPIAAISSWYDYYRSDGLVVAPGGYQGEDADVLARAVYTREDREVCAALMDELEAGQDRDSGDLTGFWRERDYLGDADRVEASVFVVHGLNDWNVKTRHFAQWWDALGRNGVDRRLWLHQSGHADPASVRRDEWLTAITRWMDHWLYGVDNGVMAEPAVEIQREDLSWTTADAWPAAGTRDVRLGLTAGTGGAGAIGPVPGRAASGGQPLTDDAARTAEELAADPEAADPNRLAYLSPPLAEDVRISGTPTVELRASLDNRPAANLTALLVDYGTAERLDYDAGSGELRSTDYEIVTRGWTDPNNRHSPAFTSPVRQGADYRFTVEMQPDDYVFEAGHRIGLVVIASDREYTQRPAPGTRFTVTPGHSRITLPVVGGPGALGG
ncbi:X-Pro dipeptidyl-peptidase [Allonocardiopsis opalescens]|uniref:Xaa-Pro dipeptidyl-peptidase n=1 Tax=Allonocardiopsis opalescens TaxID=1144618 RepID=A0A2T0PVB4_9ACTN|nr:X-Pro dipeptidyl-peptidase [Allonocardiopsis opalescens]